MLMSRRWSTAPPRLIAPRENVVLSQPCIRAALLHRPLGTPSGVVVIEAESALLEQYPLEGIRDHRKSFMATDPGASSRQAWWASGPLQSSGGQALLDANLVRPLAAHVVDVDRPFRRPA